jgi:Flp pilus assembly protein TadB
VRVPESSFDAAVKRFATLGKVQSVSTSSEDVTSQYVDLQARLRHYRAVESRLVRFLAATGNVNQMLAVQDRIDNVQLTIEQLSAQLKSLRETTAYGTLSIYLREKGVTQAGALDPSDTFTGTLLKSLRVLGQGARVTGLVLTALLPFVIVFGGIGLIVWFVARRVRRGPRRPSQPSLPA